eukprot:GHVH01002021.1.p1 GENE.GHVH01002021.1~~GHVH01002021.1.p1  ORF type:complete len:198 (+),score=28.02 GHVH01002021.1:238-831(+)
MSSKKMTEREERCCRGVHHDTSSAPRAHQKSQKNKSSPKYQVLLSADSYEKKKMDFRSLSSQGVDGQFKLYQLGYDGPKRIGQETRNLKDSIQAIQKHEKHHQRVNDVSLEQFMQLMEILRAMKEQNDTAARERSQLPNQVEDVIRKLIISNDMGAPFLFNQPQNKIPRTSTSCTELVTKDVNKRTPVNNANVHSSR